MIYATRRYIDGLTTALTSETGVTLEDGDRWCADVRNRKLIYNQQELLDFTPDEAKGLLLHEIGHLKYTGDTKPSELEKKYPIMHEVLNAFEDIRIEKKLSDEYGGFADQPLGAIKELVIDTAKQQTDHEPQDILKQVLSYNIVQATTDRTEQIRLGVYDKQKSYYHKMSKEAQTFFDEHENELFKVTNDVVNAKDLQEAKQIVEDKAYPILKELIDQIPKDKQEKELEKAQAKNSKKTAPPDSNNKGKRIFNKIPEDYELDAILQPYINTLAGRLGDILKERKAVKLTGLHRTGKLLSKNAYRVLTDEVRIFSRKTQPDKADYKITLCLDGSGSMRHTKHINTYIASFLMMRVFEKLQFPIEYIHFMDDAYLLKDLSIYRDFEDNHSNNEREALKIAIKRLDTERENIVLVMTDGQLCSPIKAEIETLKKRGAIVMGVGVGMDDNELQEAYGQAVNVPDVSQLPTAIIGILKRLITR